MNSSKSQASLSDWQKATTLWNLLCLCVVNIWLQERVLIPTYGSNNVGNITHELYAENLHNLQGYSLPNIVRSRTLDRGVYVRKCYKTNGEI